MADYEKLYYYLFNQITDAIEALKARNAELAESILVQSQQNAEEMFIGNH